MFASARRPTTTCCWPLFWLSALVLRTARTNQVCNELVYLGGDFGTHSGSFSSPGYPSGTYPSRERCTWIIKVPLNYRVLLHFTDFEVEACPSPNNYCNCDYVEVTDGQLLINKPLAKLCGNTIPSDLLSSGRFVRVDLVTDESNNRQGFAAKFYSVSPEGVTPSNLDMDKATKMKTIPPFTDVPGKGKGNMAKPTNQTERRCRCHIQHQEPRPKGISSPFHLRLRTHQWFLILHLLIPCRPYQWVNLLPPRSASLH